MPPPIIQPHAEDVLEVANRVAQRVHLRLLAVAPHDRHFFHLEASPAGQLEWQNAGFRSQSLSNSRHPGMRPPRVLGEIAAIQRYQRAGDPG